MTTIVPAGFVVTVGAPTMVVVGRCRLPQSRFAAVARSPFGRDETYSPWLRAFSHVTSRRVVGVVVGGLVVVVSTGAAVTTTTPAIEVDPCAPADPPAPTTRATETSGTKKRVAFTSPLMAISSALAPTECGR